MCFEIEYANELCCDDVARALFDAPLNEVVSALDWLPVYEPAARLEYCPRKPIVELSACALFVALLLVARELRLLPEPAVYADARDAVCDEEPARELRVSRSLYLSESRARSLRSD